MTVAVPFGGDLTAQRHECRDGKQGNKRKGSAQDAVRTQTAGVFFSSSVKSSVSLPFPPSLHLCPTLQEKSVFTGPSLFSLILIHH